MITENDKAAANVAAICERCGELVLWIRQEDTTQRILHDGCGAPVVRLTVHDPKRLGIVTNIS